MECRAKQSKWKIYVWFYLVVIFVYVYCIIYALFHQFDSKQALNIFYHLTVTYCLTKRKGISTLGNRYFMSLMLNPESFSIICINKKCETHYVFLWEYGHRGDSSYWQERYRNFCGIQNRTCEIFRMILLDRHEIEVNCNASRQGQRLTNIKIFTTRNLLSKLL